MKTGKCVLGEDFISKIYDKIKEADGVIFASPVFFCDVSAQCKAVMDRSLGLIPMGAGKTSASVITCGSVGANSALHTIQGFCNMHGFSDVGWVATYGQGPATRKKARKWLTTWEERWCRLRRSSRKPWKRRKRPEMKLCSKTWLTTITLHTEPIPSDMPGKNITGVF